MDDITKQALEKVLDYMWDDEQSNYESYEDDGPMQDYHIFTSMLELRAWLDKNKTSHE